MHLQKASQLSNQWGLPLATLNLELMRLIDGQYMKTPFDGSPRMTEILKRKRYDVNHQRIERLMRVMGIAAIYPKRHTSHPQPLNQIYPYLLDHSDFNVYFAGGLVNYPAASRGVSCKGVP
jgi:hypothetical protein